MAYHRKPALRAVGRGRPATEANVRVGPVQYDGDAIRRSATIDVAPFQLLGDRVRVVGERQGPVLDAAQRPGVPARAEEGLGQRWHRLVHVEKDPAAEQARDDRGE